MRDREYLVAIMSERGILRAETLRFHDEIRSPQQVGLPENVEAPAGKLAQKMRRAIRARSREEFDPRMLTEGKIQRLRALVNDKLKNRKDVITEEEPEDEVRDGANVVDLMQVLKERLQGRTGGARKKAGPPRKRSDKKRKPESGLEQLNRDELYELARDKDVPGRSRMKRSELVTALQQARCEAS